MKRVPDSNGTYEKVATMSRYFCKICHTKSLLQFIKNNEKSTLHKTTLQNVTHSQSVLFFIPIFSIPILSFNHCQGENPPGLFSEAESREERCIREKFDESEGRGEFCIGE